jgi:hypothetical protein
MPFSILATTAQRFCLLMQELMPAIINTIATNWRD